MQRFILTVCFIAAISLEVFGFFESSGRNLYDITLHYAYHWGWSTHPVVKTIDQTRPVLIAIDERSLATLGRWPWSRKVHADLLNQLSTLTIKPKLVAFDVIFSEPENNNILNATYDGDMAFADSIQNAPFPVILATQVEDNPININLVSADSTQLLTSSRLMTPHEPLSNTSARLAHVHLYADKDGTIRRYPIDPIQLGDKTIPYLGQALLTPDKAPTNLSINELHNNDINNINTSIPSIIKPIHQIKNVGLYPIPNDWIKVISYETIINNNNNDNHFNHFNDFNHFDKTLLDNAIVLIATTAQGLGDQYVSPIQSPDTIIEGGRLVLAAYHTEQLLNAGLPELSNASQSIQVIGLMITLSLMLLGLRHSIGFKKQLLLFFSLTISIYLFSVYLLMIYGQWFNPVGSLLTTIITWLLWLLYKHQQLISYLLNRFKRYQVFNIDYNKDTHIKTDTPVFTLKSKNNPVLKDVVNEHINAIEALDNQALSEFKRMGEIVSLMPDATLIFNISDTSSYTLTINQVNQAVYTLCHQYNHFNKLVHLYTNHKNDTHHIPLTLNTLLSEFNPDLTEAQTHIIKTYYANQFEWNQLFHLIYNTYTNNNTINLYAFKQGVESSTLTGQRYLIKLVLISTDNNIDSYILTIIDLSAGLALSQQREQTLNFLSHDLRSPQVSILALLDLERDKYNNNNNNNNNNNELNHLFNQIEYQAKRTLELSESFIQWSKANHIKSYQWVEYDLNELMIEAVDELWAMAKQSQVKLITEPYSSSLWVYIDRNLMWRTLTNLISNALKVSINGSDIQIKTDLKDKYAILSVSDSGCGIPIELHSTLFEPFAQGQGLKCTGVGLGLAFVKMVSHQHQGFVKVISPTVYTPNPHGTRFEVWIPYNDTSID